MLCTTAESPRPHRTPLPSQCSHVPSITPSPHFVAPLSDSDCVYDVSYVVWIGPPNSSFQQLERIPNWSLFPNSRRNKNRKGPRGREVLWKSLLQRCGHSEKKIRLGAKLRLYKAIVVPTALYASETWRTTKANERKIDAFQQRCLRRILGIT